ncbi:MBL fold metallo-hydrolase [Kitasatospora sp. NBC_01266]|uniref:MBL fold metallo-hydrolase n=1 Tax=Kitasatospora sp. NBC_01266 TaxID=2903572 RepID=UPI002E37C029|nr:MBL fold metallo-hydrolase [Kitasatospora sp. NBC_01266]
MTRTTDGGPIDFVSAAPITGSLAVSWIHGAPGRRPADDPAIQIHHYDEHTVILRQSKSVNYEAPFIFLLFGNDRALLLDTGATADPDLFPLRATVDRLIAEWLDRNPAEHDEGRAPYELVIAHTHGHGDHVAADAQFADRPATTVVPREVEAVRSFFGLGDNWPLAKATFDLGGRVLEILASPGHHQAAITSYDPWTGLLFTGDTVLPGRLYVADSAAFLASMERLVAFAGTRPVTHVLGCHVEMNRRPGGEYPIGAGYQPDERALEMTVDQLTAIRDAAAALAGRRGVHRFDDFILYNEPRKADMLKLMARGLVHQLLDKFRK